MILSPDVMSSGRTFRGSPPSALRSPGRHVSAINRYLGIAAGKLSDADADDFPFVRFSPTEYPMLPAIGVAWEEFRISHYTEAECVWQPYELSNPATGGEPYGTPDGLLFEPETDDFSCYLELKYSTKKLQSVASLWMYLKQGLTYCAMSTSVHAKRIRRVQYDICFGLGDYSRPYQPVGQISKVEFTDQEISTWWNIILREMPNVKPESHL